MSLARDLVVPALERVVERTGAVEVLGPDGGPFRSLTATADGTPAGSVRVFESAAVPRIAYCNLDLRARQLDSHMLYAFAPAASGVPHFTVDAVAVQGVQAYHVDLMPRVDLATAPAYLDAVLAPLDDAFAAVAADEAYRPAVLTPKARALMSPWMLAHRLSAADFGKVAEPVDAYLEHWLALAEHGVGATAEAALAGADLAGRDALTRTVIFGGDVDPAWDIAVEAVGAEPVAALRALLVGP